MRKMKFIKSIAGFLFLMLSAPTSIPAADRSFRVGIVLPGDQWASSVDGFKEGMQKLGYTEGKEIVYDLENAKGSKEKVKDLTRKFVAEKVDLIYTITNTALKVIAQETKASKTPVLFGSASGPVESGVVPAYASPDTHITGVTSGSIELVGKRLEILKEVLPTVKKVTIIGDLEADSSKAAFTIAAQIAPKLGLIVTEIRIKSREEALDAVKKLTRRETDVLFLIPSLHAVGDVSRIAREANANRLPFAVYQVEHVKADGALLSYGSSYYLQGKQAAELAHKILKGTPPSRLPIERPAQHELILNLDTARELGIRFSSEVLNRADELIGERN